MAEVDMCLESGRHNGLQAAKRRASEPHDHDM
jgi:hypothetical protein